MQVSTAILIAKKFVINVYFFSLTCVLLNAGENLITNITLVL
jgi:hypothetical protein